jgi:glucose-1-phosphate cytidylyltransferase
MDVVILCGGRGTRLSEETIKTPKPMVEVGGMPILWHIMKIYSHYGYNRFILALGYKSEIIKQYFYNYKNISGDFSLQLNPEASPVYFNHSTEKNWEIVFVNTGLDTLKGGRIKRVEKYIQSEAFHLTYGDGVGDINVNKLVEFHKSRSSIGTVTAVRPPSRFGEMNIKEGRVINFEEKPQMDTGYINGGFFIFERKLFSYLTPDENCDFEFGPLQTLAREGQLQAYRHDGFWQCMDNVRERDYLNKLISDKKAPWMMW